MNNKDILSLIIRYGILTILGLTNLTLFYFIFTPLTVYPVFFLLSSIKEGVTLISVSPIPTILFSGYLARIIPACVAGAAYYLLLILNLATPMSPKKRTKSLVFLFVTFLLINIIRITLFALIVPQGYKYFDATHELTWYLGSTIMIIVIWFTNVYLFKIKSAPFYSDIKMIYLDASRKTK